LNNRIKDYLEALINFCDVKDEECVIGVVVILSVSEES